MDWAQMAGDDRTRYCSHCKLNVYNFSRMTEREIKQLIREREGQRICGRLYRRSDGTVLTKDCKGGVGAGLRRASHLVVGSLSAAMSLSFLPAVAQTPSPQPLVQINEAQTGIDLRVLDLEGAVVPRASIVLMGANLPKAITGWTDQVGQWQIRDVAPGQYRLVIDAQGFLPSTQTVTIANGTLLSLSTGLTAVGKEVTVGEIVPIRHRNPVQKLVYFFTRH